MGISVWQLLIVLLIVVLLFGTRRLSSIGKDMGSAVKGFRDAMKDSEAEREEGKGRIEHTESSRIIEGEVERKKEHKV